MPSITPSPLPTPMSESSKPVRMYTMPEKFHVDDGASGGGSNKILIILIVILVVAIVGGGGYFLYKKFIGSNTNATTNENQNSVVNNSNIPSNVNSNANANKNTNVLANNANSTTNGVSNSIINLNTNSVGNLNIFPNFNTNNTNTTVNANITLIPSSQDSDSDGLTDTEEAVWGTNANKPDTDGDGYSDGQEVIGGYNPTGSGTITSSSAIKTYTNSQLGYTLLYLSSWVASADPQNTRGEMFTTNGEFIEVSVQENPAMLSARDWYLTKSPGVNSSAIKSITNWNKTLSGVLSLDETTAYYTYGQKVFIVNYNTSLLTQANFKSTFQVMYRSLDTATVSTNTNSSINGNISTTNSSSNNNATTNSSANTNTNSNTNTTNTNSNLNSTSNRL